MELLTKIIVYYSYLIFGYFIIVNFIYTVLTIVSLIGTKDYVRKIEGDITSISTYTKPISVIVPAFNEEKTIIENITSLLDLNYPQFELVVVNDGSKDDTLTTIINHFNLRKIDIDINYSLKCEKVRGVYSSFEHQNLLIIDKENGGKADALNAGINVSRYPLFCAIDADCIIERNALLKIVKPFLNHNETIAVGGIVRIANGLDIKDGKVAGTKLPKKRIERFQIIEYYRAFLTSRVGWGSYNALLIISGAFGLFKKSSVVDVGGYIKTIGEDMELTLRLHEYYRDNKIPYNVEFVSDAVCFTQAPDTLKGLKTQRVRWHRGLLDSLSKHKKMMFNPRYGVIGLISMPYFWIFELMGPLVEIVGYLVMIIAIIIGIVSKYFILVFLMAYLYGVLFSLAALFTEQSAYGRFVNIKENTILILDCLIEQLLYRQLTVIWRGSSFLNYKKGSEKWGSIKRKSFN